MVAATPSPLPGTGDFFSPVAFLSSETSLTSLHPGSSFGEHKEWQRNKSRNHDSGSWCNVALLWLPVFTRKIVKFSSRERKKSILPIFEKNLKKKNQADPEISVNRWGQCIYIEM